MVDPAVAAGATTVLPVSRIRRTVTLPDTIEAHTSVPQWRRAADDAEPVPAGRARRSGMRWSADPADGWSLLPGEGGGVSEETRQRGRTLVPEEDYRWLPENDGVDADQARSRRIVGLVVVLLFLVVVLVGGGWALNNTGLVNRPSAEPTVVVVTVEPTPPVAPPVVEAPPPQPVTAAGVQPLDPPPGDNDERDDEAPRAIDGDPATAWTTETYRSQDFGGLKEGVGLLVALPAPTTTTTMTITAPGVEGRFEVRGATQPAYEGSTVLAEGQTSDAGPVTLTWAATETSFLIVWFTALPQADTGEWRGAIAEIQLA